MGQSELDEDESDEGEVLDASAVRDEERRPLCPSPTSLLLFLCLTLLGVCALSMWTGALRCRVRSDDPSAPPPSLYPSPSSTPPLPGSPQALTLALWPNATSLRISLMFNVYINPHNPHWRELIRLMVQDLHEYQITELAVVHIALQYPSDHFTDARGEELGNEGEEWVRSLLPHAIIHRSAGNRYEYPGLRVLWDLGQPWGEWMEPGRTGVWDPSQHFILSMHTKSMNRTEEGVVRTSVNAVYTRSVLVSWREVVVPRMLSDPAVMKVAMTPSGLGFVWMNFYWVRASYLRTVVRPILTDRRHYYEDWIGRVNDRPGERQARTEAGVFKGAENSLSLCKANKEMRLNYSLEPDRFWTCLL